MRTSLRSRAKERLETGIDPDSYYRMERGYGMFSRSFTLTKSIDAWT